MVEIVEREGEKAVERALRFIVECLELGGIPHVRVKYGGLPIRKQGLRGVILTCYGRAEYLEPLRLYCPGSEREWYEFVKFCEGETSDYKAILEKYKEEIEKLRREVIEELKKRYKEKLEEIRRQPIYGKD